MSITDRRLRVALLLLGALANTVLAPAVSAQENDAAGGETAESDDEEPTVIENVGGFVDRAQQQASEQFNDFVLQVDDFFGSGTEGNFNNTSWARLRLDVGKPGDEDVEIGGTVKLRIVLPRAEQRFRLLLSSEDEDSTVTESDVSRPARISTDEGRDVSLALRFIRTARRNGSVNFDLGVRQRDDNIQFFGRINTSVRGEMARYWYGAATNNYYYYSRSGFENRLRLDARRKLFRRDFLFFRSSTGFRWEKGFKGASISQTLGLYAELSPRKAIALEALAGYTTSLNEGESARYRGAEVRVRWRHNVWREWFFYEVWPSVSWPASNDYERAYGGLVRVEVLIGNPSG